MPACLMLLRVLDRLLVGGENGEAFETTPRLGRLPSSAMAEVLPLLECLGRQPSTVAALPVCHLACVGGIRVRVADRKEQRLRGSVSAGNERAETGLQQRDQCFLVKRLDHPLGQGQIRGEIGVAFGSDRSHHQPPQVNSVQRPIGYPDRELERPCRCSKATPPSTSDSRLRERLLARRTVNQRTGCWEWQGRRDRWGYGRITVAHRRYSVHRLSAALFLGFDLSSPLHILHRCHNPPCFRPDHLHPGTHQENMRDRRNSALASRGATLRLRRETRERARS